MNRKPCWDGAFDAEGTPLVVGQMVAKAYKSGSSALVERRTVARIDGNVVYLDGERARPIDPCKVIVIS